MLHSQDAGRDRDDDLGFGADRDVFVNAYTRCSVASQRFLRVGHRGFPFYSFPGLSGVHDGRVAA